MINSFELQFVKGENYSGNLDYLRKTKVMKLETCIKKIVF